MRERDRERVRWCESEMVRERKERDGQIGGKMV